QGGKRQGPAAGAEAGLAAGHANRGTDNPSNRSGQASRGWGSNGDAPAASAARPRGRAALRAATGTAKVVSVPEQTPGRIARSGVFHSKQALMLGARTAHPRT